MTLATLKTQILRYAYNRTDLDDVLGDFVTLAESEMRTGIRRGQPLRIDELTKSVELTLTDWEVAIPSDYEASIRLSVGTIPLTYVIPAKWTGVDGTYTIENGLIKSATDILLINYHYSLPPLVDDTDTNTVLENYNQLYLYGSLKHLFSFIDEPEQLGKYAVLFAEAIANVNSLNKARQTDTDRLVMR